MFNMAKVIALDAGHGLYTSGKQTPDGIKEWTLNDKVRDKVIVFLKDYDVKFVFPDNDEGVTDEGLTARRTMYVNKKVDAAVSIHHNAFKGTWGSATGVEVYTDKNPTAADTKLAKAIYSRLHEYTGLRGRGIKKANWTVINQNSVPAVLTEGGFMDTKSDHAIITSSAGQTAYAKAVAEGLIEFLGLKKKTEVPVVFHRVQTGAFRNKAYAVELFNKVKSAGFNPCMVLYRGLYKIQVGAYKKESNATNMAKKLKTAGFQAYITTDGGVSVPNT